MSLKWFSLHNNKDNPQAKRIPKEITDDTEQEGNMMTLKAMKTSMISAKSDKTTGSDFMLSYPNHIDSSNTDKGLSLNVFAPNDMKRSKCISSNIKNPICINPKLNLVTSAIKGDLEKDDDDNKHFDNDLMEKAFLALNNLQLRAETRLNRIEASISGIEREKHKKNKFFKAISSLQV